MNVLILDKYRSFYNTNVYAWLFKDKHFARIFFTQFCRYDEGRCISNQSNFQTDLPVSDILAFIIPNALSWPLQTAVLLDIGVWALIQYKDDILPV